MFVKAAALAAAFTVALSVAIAAPALGGGCDVPAGASEGSGIVVAISKCQFGPTILRAPVGATITWTNDDFLPHAVNGAGWSGTPPGAPAPPNTSVSHTFDKAGIYPYMCYVHPGMAGVVIVGDAPFPALGNSADAGTSSAASTNGLPTSALAGALVVGAALGAAATALLARRYRRGRYGDAVQHVVRHDGDLAADGTGEHDLAVAARRSHA